MIKISVIIPVYNVEKYLRECLDSIVRQTLKEIEIICVNDGSTDGSLHILEEYAHKDSRIVVISKENSGYGHTMNMGIENASGKYINFLESDDYVDANMLEELFELAEGNNLEVIKTDSRSFVDVKGVHEFTYRTVLGKADEALYGKIISSRESKDAFAGYVYTWAGMYRRDFIERYHIRHNESPGASYQDNGFWFQTSMFANRLLFHHQAYYNLRRDNPNSSIHSKEKVFCICDEYDFIDKRIEEADLADKQSLFEISMLWRIKNYIGMYGRIDEQHRNAYWARIKRDVLYGIKRGRINPILFSQREWRYIHYLTTSDVPAHIDLAGMDNAVKKRLEMAERIYLYGAGSVAVSVMKILENANCACKITGVIVSKKNVNSFQNLPVLQIEEAKLTGDDLVIVSVGSRNREAVQNNLKEHNIFQYFSIDDLR